MKPEIKFRGKYNQSSNWVYGHYFNNHDCGCNKNLIITSNDDWEVIEHEIDQRYLCQYTGLCDMTGQELYDGDLFKSSSHPNVIFRVYRAEGGFVFNTPVKIWMHEILKDEVPFPCESLSENQNISWFKGSCYIIGNVFDHKSIIESHLSVGV